MVYSIASQPHKSQLIKSIFNGISSSYCKLSTLCLLIKEKDFSISEIQEKMRRFGSRGLPIIHHHDYVSELPPEHRFAMKKFHGVMNFLQKDGIVSLKQVVEPEPISQQTMSLVHTSSYSEKFFQGTTAEEEQRRTGFKWNEGLLRRCRLETGGSVLGAELALERGLACSTGGGTHHAHADFGSGFCLINDLAVTAKYLLSQRKVDKVLIVDLDVHQGDGTAAIFQNEPNVFTFSMHAEKNFPFRKQVSDLDVGLPDKTKDEDYMLALCHHLPAVLFTFQPSLVLYNAGVDPHFDDELGRLSLTDTGLFERDEFVMSECVSQGIPCMTVIGGGYSRDIDKLSLRHTIVHRAAAKIWYHKGL